MKLIHVQLYMCSHTFFVHENISLATPWGEVLPAQSRKSILAAIRGLLNMIDKHHG